MRVSIPLISENANHMIFSSTNPSVGDKINRTEAKYKNQKADDNNKDKDNATWWTTTTMKTQQSTTNMEIAISHLIFTPFVDSFLLWSNKREESKRQTTKKTTTTMITTTQLGRQQRRWKHNNQRQRRKLNLGIITIRTQSFNSYTSCWFYFAAISDRQASLFVDFLAQYPHHPQFGP